MLVHALLVLAFVNSASDLVLAGAPDSEAGEIDVALVSAADLQGLPPAVRGTEKPAPLDSIFKRLDVDQNGGFSAAEAPQPRTSLDDVLGAPDQAESQAADAGPQVESGRKAAARPGESAVQIDYLASASVPAPKTPPPSSARDLPSRIGHCWTPSFDRTVVLLVELTPTGNLANLPRALRHKGAPVGSADLRAEAAAARAVAACAPYADGPRRMRITFPQR